MYTERTLTTKTTMHIHTELEIMDYLLANKDPKDCHNTMIIGDTPEEDYEGELYNLGYAMSAIDRFIKGVNELQVNPLPHLRRRFKDFTWESAEFDTNEFLDADYIWRFHGKPGALIVAKEKNSSERRKVCYNEKGELDWHRPTLEAAGVRIIRPMDHDDWDQEVTIIQDGKEVEV